jgi:hypothetical protein
MREDAVGVSGFSERPCAYLRVVSVIESCSLSSPSSVSYLCVFLSFHSWSRPRTYILRNDWLWPALWKLPVNESYAPWPMSSTSSINYTGSLLSLPPFFCRHYCKFVACLADVVCFSRMMLYSQAKLTYAPPSLRTASRLSSLTWHAVISWNRVATTHRTLRSASTPVSSHARC